MQINNSRLYVTNNAISFFENQTNPHATKIEIYSKGVFSTLRNLVRKNEDKDKKISIEVVQENKIKSVFIKVSQLNQALNLEEGFLLKHTKGKSAAHASHLLKVETAVETIHRTNPSLGKDQIRKGIAELLKGHVTLDQLMRNLQKDPSKKMINTWMALGGLALKDIADEDKPYPISINANGECQINQETIHTLNIPPHLKDKFNQHKEVVAEFFNHFGLRKSNDLPGLLSFIDKTGIFPFDAFKHEDKTVIFNTFIQIGKSLQTSDMSERYFKRLGKKGKRATFAYALTQHHAIITLSALGEGTYKKVNSAVKINFLEKVPEQKISAFVRQKPHPKAIKDFTIKIANKELMDEAQKLEDLGPHANIVDRYLLKLSSNSGKAVLFQTRYDGDGNDLKNADFRQIMNALEGILSALIHVHEKGFVHLDVKPANFLISGNKDGKELVTAKLADVSFIAKEGEFVNRGTPAFLSPEAWHSISKKKDFQATEKTDCYAFGKSILAYLNEGRIRKFSINKNRYNKQLESHIGNIANRIAKNEKYSDEEKSQRLNLLFACHGLLAFDPEERWSLKQVQDFWDERKRLSQ